MFGKKKLTTTDNNNNSKKLIIIIKVNLKKSTYAHRYLIKYKKKYSFSFQLLKIIFHSTLALMKVK
jgi:hypothetical protein